MREQIHLLLASVYYLIRNRKYSIFHFLYKIKI